MLPAGRDLSRSYHQIQMRVRRTTRTRLDRYLQERLGWTSRTRVQKLVRLGRVEVNGEVAKPSTRVSVGDQLLVKLNAGGLPLEKGGRPLGHPLWQDPWLIAIDKPAGRLVHPVGRTLSGTILNELHHHFREVNLSPGPEVIPRLCHRLDRDTSGLLLIATTIEARRRMQIAFEKGEVKKCYIAVVEGEVESDSFEVDVSVQAHLDRSRRGDNRLARAAVEGKESLTRFQLLGRGRGFSILLCRPITGRQNQIRIHLQSAGHPILGDGGYGATEESFKAGGGILPAAVPYPRRALLHSWKLRFPHPIWRLQYHLECPLPGDQRPFLEAAALSKLPSFVSLAITG